MNENVRKALRNAVLIVGSAVAISVFIWGGPSTQQTPQRKAVQPKTEAQRATEGPFSYGSSELRKDAETRLACYCATDYNSIGPVLRAYKDSDVVALAGLIDRGKAIELAKGTRVYVVGREDGVATVLVESGYHSGQKCYVWGKFIQ
jgi:hypothetical protein